MPVPIPTSVGYEGTIDESQWANLIATAGGGQYGVRGPDDWAVTTGSADREVRIAPGSGFGWGVTDTSIAIASLTLPAPASGSRWHLIATRRSWQANESSFVSLPGGTDAPALPAREQSPGTVDDQPLALARVQAGSSQVVELIDLRVWQGDGGVIARHELVQQP